MDKIITGAGGKDALEKQIDAIVYKLYGLTAEEIKVIEGVGK